MKVTKSLCEICSPKQWKTIPASLLTESGYPVYGANGTIGFYSSYNHEKETLLITCRGATCGRLNICKPFSYVTGNSMALDDLSDEVDLRFLYYYLLNRGLDDVITGSAQPQIVRKSLEKVNITFPPLEIQHSIIKRLDKLSTLISLRKQQLAKLDELVKARFVEMFGDLSDPANKWEKSRLSDVCATPDDIKCGPFGTQLGKDEYVENGIAVWEIPQINSRFQLPPTHYVTDEKAKILSAYSISSGDIAMSRKGNVGKCAVFPDGFPDGIIHSDVLRIRADKRIVNSFFLMQQLHDSRAVQHQIEMVSSGAIMAGINVKKLKHISIAVPPMEMQESFYRFSMKVNDSKTTIQHSLEKLETLKKAQMQEYFG